MLKHFKELTPPIHTKYRKNSLNKAFTASRVKELKPSISKIINDLIDGFIENECEFVEEFAVPIPCTVIADQLGVPREKLHKLKEWTDAMIISFGVATVDDMKKAAFLEAESQHYFDKIFEEKRINPTNDIISELVNLKLENGQKLSNDELHLLLNFLQAEMIYCAWSLVVIKIS